MLLPLLLVITYQQGRHLWVSQLITLTGCVSFRWSHRLVRDPNVLQSTIAIVKSDAAELKKTSLVWLVKVYLLDGHGIIAVVIGCSRQLVLCNFLPRSNCSVTNFKSEVLGPDTIRSYVD